MTKVELEDLGLISYQEALDYQKKCVLEVLNGSKQRLILCEHPVTLTLGRMTKEENIFLSQEEADQKKIEIIKVDRGGDVTLHAPGQLIIYPILDLSNFDRDLHVYLHKLEQVVIDLLKDFDIVAKRSEINTGAWIESKKIASIGIGVKKWISYHGIGINIATDLNLFSLIRPCGLNINMTSMESVLEKDLDLRKIKEHLIYSFEKNFNVSVESKECKNV